MRKILPLLLIPFINGCVTLPNCSIGSLPEGPKRIFKDVDAGINLTSSPNGQGLGLSFEPWATTLSPYSYEKITYKNAQLILRNSAGNTINTMCDTVLYSIFQETIRYSSPAFVCEDRNFSEKLERFIKGSSSISGALHYDEIFSRGKITVERKRIKFKFKSKVIADYRKNGMIRSATGEACSVDSYKMLFAGGGSIFKRVAVDKKTTKNPNISHNIHESDFILCMKKYGAKNTSPNDYEQIEINFTAKALCKAEMNK